MKLTFLVVVVCVMLTGRFAVAQESVSIVVDPSEPIGVLRHIWSYYGFDECNLAERETGQALLRALAGTTGLPKSR